MKKFFSETSNLLSFLLGLIPGIMFYIYPPNKAVPFLLFAITLLIAIISIWLNIKQSLESNESTRVAHITVLEFTKGRCLCKANNFITHDSLICFYKRTGGLQEFVTYGVVESINNHNVAQIVIKSLDADARDTFTFLSEHKDNIIIIPTITRNLSVQIAEIINSGGSL